MLERFPTIVDRLAGMVDGFTSMLDCVDVGYLPDGILDELPQPAQIGTTRVAGLDLNKTASAPCWPPPSPCWPPPSPCWPPPSPWPSRPTGSVAQIAAKVQTMTGQTDQQYSTRQAAYDLRKLRGKQLVVKPGPDPALPRPTRRGPHHLRPHRPPRSGRRSPPRRCPHPLAGRKPATWTRIDDDYLSLRLGLQTLFRDHGIAA